MRLFESVRDFLIKEDNFVNAVVFGASILFLAFFYVMNF